MGLVGHRLFEELAPRLEDLVVREVDEGVPVTRNPKVVAHDEIPRKPELSHANVLRLPHCRSSRRRSARRSCHATIVSEAGEVLSKDG